MMNKSPLRSLGFFFLIMFLSTSFFAQAEEKNADQASQFYQKGKAMLRKGDIDSMAYYWHRALFLFEKGEDIEGMYNCYFGFSSVYMQLGQFDKAMTYSDSTFWVAAKNDSDADLLNEHLTYAHYRRANIHNLAFSFELAINDYQKAIDYELARAEPDSNHMSRTWNNLALLYRNAGDYKKALDGYQHALNYGDAISWGVKAAILNNIGHLHFDNNDFSPALDFFDRAYQIYRNNVEVKELKLTFAEAGNYINICNNLGKVYHKLLDFKKAEQLLRESLKLQDEFKHSIAQLFTYRYLGQLYLDQTQFQQKGMQYLVKSLELAKEQFSPPNKDLATSYFVIGKAHDQNNKLEKALSYYEAARLSLLQPKNKEQRLPQTPLEVFSEVTLLKLLVAEGNALWRQYQIIQEEEILHQALENFAFMDRLIEQMRRGYLSQESKEFLATAVHDAYGVAIRVAQSLHKLTAKDIYANTVLNFFESSKAMILLESLEANEGKIFQIVRSNKSGQALLEEEASLKAKMANYKRLIFEAGNDTEQVKKWSQLLFEVNQDFDVLQNAFKREFPEYYTLKFHTDTLTLAKARTLLPDRDVFIIEYYIDSTSLITYALGTNTFYINETQIGEQEHQILNGFLREVSNYSFYQNADFSFSQFSKFAYKCYELLLEKEQEKIPETVNTLIIVPDGLLNIVPFAALITQMPQEYQIPNYGLENMSYLLEKYDLRYAYSLKSLLHYQKLLQSSTKKAPFAGFAPAFTGSDSPSVIRSCDDGPLGDLKHTKDEVTRIAANINGDVYLGNNASSEQFRQLANDYQILHLATHACVNTDDPLFGRIYFGPDDYLYTVDLYNLQLGAELVVLSACETGIGQIVAGEGVQSLARAIAYSGCPSTLTSLWSISDQATAEIMTNYYQTLGEGKTKSEALRTAQLNYLQQQKSAQQHPVYWAGFSQIGVNTPIEFSKGSSMKMVFYVLAALIIIGLYFWFSSAKK